MISNVAMIGLGKLGLPVAESMAKMYNVSGYDIVAKQSDKIKIADTLEEACKDAEIIFIAMPTPHDPSYGGEKPISSKIKKDFRGSKFDHKVPCLNTKSHVKESKIDALFMKQA